MPYPDLDVGPQGRHRVATYRGGIRCFDIMEMYNPDRFCRQFGRRQSRPLDVPEPVEYYCPPKSMRGGREYTVRYGPEWDRWDQRYDNLCQYIMSSPPALIPWDAEDAYLDWFAQVSHPYVSPNAPARPRTC